MIKMSASKIRDVYAFIAQNYEDGDEICLFGLVSPCYILPYQTFD